MPPLPSTVWAVPPDPTGSAPSWTAGWAALTTPTTLAVHLPPPASASAHVDLRVFTVVRTRTVRSAFPFFGPPASSTASAGGRSDAPSFPSTPPASASSSGSSSPSHARVSSLAAWLRPTTYKRGPLSFDARTPAANPRSCEWEVELLTPSNGSGTKRASVASASAVRWSDADTGSSVAAAAQQTRFVFRVADAEAARAWAATLAPLLGVPSACPLGGPPSPLTGRGRAPPLLSTEPWPNSQPLPRPELVSAPTLPTPLPPPSGPVKPSFLSSRPLPCDGPGDGASNELPQAGDKNSRATSTLQRSMSSSGTLSMSTDSSRVRPSLSDSPPRLAGEPLSSISSGGMTDTSKGTCQSKSKGKLNLWNRLRSGGSTGKHSVHSPASVPAGCESKTSLATAPASLQAGADSTPSTPVLVGQADPDQDLEPEIRHGRGRGHVNRVLRRPRSSGQLLTSRSPSVVRTSQSALGFSTGSRGPAPSSCTPAAQSEAGAASTPGGGRGTHMVSTSITPTSLQRPRLWPSNSLHLSAATHAGLPGQWASPVPSPMLSPPLAPAPSPSLPKGSLDRTSFEDIPAWLHQFRHQGSTVPAAGSALPGAGVGATTAGTAAFSPVMHTSSIHSVGSRSGSVLRSRSSNGYAQSPPRTLNHFTSMPALREEQVRGRASRKRGSFSFMPDVVSGIADKLAAGSSSVWTTAPATGRGSGPGRSAGPAASASSSPAAGRTLHTPYDPRIPPPSAWGEDSQSCSSDAGSEPLLSSTPGRSGASARCPRRSRSYAGMGYIVDHGPSRSPMATTPTLGTSTNPGQTDSRPSRAPSHVTKSAGIRSSLLLETGSFQPHALVLAALEADKSSSPNLHSPLPSRSPRSLSRAHSGNEHDGFGTTFGQQGTLSSALLSEDQFPRLEPLQV